MNLLARLESKCSRQLAADRPRRCLTNERLTDCQASLVGAGAGAEALASG